MVKGNSGKAARNRHLQRLLFVVLSCFSIIVIYELSGLKKTKRKTYAKVQQHILNKIGRYGESPKRLRRARGDEINYSKLSREEEIDLIVSGKVHLINIRVKTEIADSNEFDYDGVIGYFCQLDWSLHKTEPSKYPMFRDLVGNSNCENPLLFDLKEAVHLIKKADKSSTYENSHTMKPKGFVFHESRCGSTLAANALIAAEPTQNRVYSESTPPITALRACGLGGRDCSDGTAAKLFKDVIYVMGRTNDENESNLFFKIQSIGTKYIDVFLEAFPKTPWIFIYRNPIHVMMSQLEMGAKRANCVHQLKDVPKETRQMLGDMGMQVHDLIPEEKCALHLSLLCKSAVRAFENSGLGRAVNYDGIVDTLITDIIPDHFNYPMTEARSENVLAIGSKYSKGRGSRSGEFKEDNKKKEDLATPEVKGASEKFLVNWYEQLELFRRNNNNYGPGDIV